MLSLKEKYIKEVIPAMQKQFGYRNLLAVPKVEKVTINMGFGKLIAGKTTDERKKIQDFILNDLSLISGQRPILRKAKKSVSGFKLRKGMPIATQVTLRGKKMYDFLERLIHVGLPRSRDFRGIDKKSFDRERNLTIGIKEHICFPEVDPEKIKFIFSFETTVTTTAKKREEGIILLRLLGFPIKD